MKTLKLKLMETIKTNEKISILCGLDVNIGKLEIQGATRPSF